MTTEKRSTTGKTRPRSRPADADRRRSGRALSATANAESRPSAIWASGPPSAGPGGHLRLVRTRHPLPARGRVPNGAPHRVGTEHGNNAGQPTPASEPLRWSIARWRSSEPSPRSKCGPLPPSCRPPPQIIRRAVPRTGRPTRPGSDLRPRRTQAAPGHDGADRLVRPSRPLKRLVHAVVTTTVDAWLVLEARGAVILNV